MFRSPQLAPTSNALGPASRGLESSAKRLQAQRAAPILQAERQHVCIDKAVQHWLEWCTLLMLLNRSAPARRRCSPVFASIFNVTGIGLCSCLSVYALSSIALGMKKQSHVAHSPCSAYHLPVYAPQAPHQSPTYPSGTHHLPSSSRTPHPRPCSFAASNACSPGCHV